MSSSVSARLDVELAHQGWLAIGLGTWLTGIVVTLLCLPLSPAWKTMTVVLVVLCGITGLRDLSAGNRRMRSFSWLGDGTWLLRDVQGTETEAELEDESRLWGRWAFLVWRSPDGLQRYALAGPGLAPGEAVRRLRLRLRQNRSDHAEK